MSEGRNKVAELEALLDDRASDIERLRAALDEQRRQVSLLNGHDTLAQFQAHIAELEEEIDRLRAALKRAATACMDHDCCVAHAVARKALGET
jgi:chromosome segregation ATPase